MEGSKDEGASSVESSGDSPRRTARLRSIARGIVLGTGLAVVGVLAVVAFGML